MASFLDFPSRLRSRRNAWSSDHATSWSPRSGEAPCWRACRPLCSRDGAPFCPSSPAAGRRRIGRRTRPRFSAFRDFPRRPRPGRRRKRCRSRRWRAGQGRSPPKPASSSPRWRLPPDPGDPRPFPRTPGPERCRRRRGRASRGRF